MKLVKYIMDGLFGPCRKACDTPDEYCYCPHNPLHQKQKEKDIKKLTEIISELDGEHSFGEILERNAVYILKVSRR